MLWIDSSHTRCKRNTSRSSTTPTSENLSPLMAGPSCSPWQSPWISIPRLPSRKQNPVFCQTHLHVHLQPLLPPNQVINALALYSPGLATRHATTVTRIPLRRNDDEAVTKNIFFPISEEDRRFQEKNISLKTMTLHSAIIIYLSAIFIYITLHLCLLYIIPNYSCTLFHFMYYPFYVPIKL